MGVRGAGGVFGGGGGGGGSSAPAFKNSVTDAAPGTNVNNYAPAGYVAGTTNRILVTAAVGGTTFTGLLAATNGWTVYIKNQSTTDNLSFLHLSGASLAANQFSCPQGVPVVLPPLTGGLFTYTVDHWDVAS